MPISGATINVICPTCGSAFDVQLDDAAAPIEIPRTVIQKTVSYRCPGCNHLGVVKAELRTE
jgi:DNA-directed RNA polymerase subunit RPC12/RpoP